MSRRPIWVIRLLAACWPGASPSQQSLRSTTFLPLARSVPCGKKDCACRKTFPWWALTTSKARRSKILGSPPCGSRCARWERSPPRPLCVALLVTASNIPKRSWSRPNWWFVNPPVRLLPRSVLRHERIETEQPADADVVIVIAVVVAADLVLFRFRRGSTQARRCGGPSVVAARRLLRNLSPQFCGQQQRWRRRPQRHPFQNEVPA